jgi:hypothetical protein
MDIIPTIVAGIHQSVVELAYPNVDVLKLILEQGIDDAP